MTIQTNMARDLLATGAQDPQDAYRIAWMKDIPRHLRKPKPALTAEDIKRGPLDRTHNGRVTGAIRAAKMKAERAAKADQLRVLLEQGLPLYRAAQSLGMGWMRAKRIAVEHGFEPAADPKSRATLKEVKKDTRPDPLRERVDAVVAMIEAGETNIKICAALGISRRSLDRLIKKLDLDLGRDRSNAIHAERNAKIIEMDRAGYGRNEIAARFGLSPSRVRKIIKGTA